MDEATKKLVEEAEARAGKATEGPLEGAYIDSTVLPGGATEGAVVMTATCELVAMMFGKRENATHDAEFFAHARQDVPALCAEVRRLDEKREKERAAWIEYVQAQSRCTVDADAFERYRKAQAELSKYVDPSSLWIRSEQ